MNLKRVQGANMKKATVAITALLLVVSFQNCSQQKLSHSSGGSSGGGGALNLGQNDNEATGVITQTVGPNCRNQLNTLTTPIKPVFIVDVSGSNFSNGALPGSDPKRIVRGDSIERFFNTFKAKANFSWSFSTFAGSVANVLLQMGNANSMSNAIIDISRHVSKSIEEVNGEEYDFVLYVFEPASLDGIELKGTPKVIVQPFDKPQQGANAKETDANYARIRDEIENYCFDFAHQYIRKLY